MNTLFWLMVAWIVLAILLAPLFGRWLEKLAEKYPEVKDE